LVRLDWEDATPCPGAAVDAMLERLRAGRAPDVIILSDYAKGLLTDEFLNTVAEAAASVGTRVVVDPKRRDLGAYPRGSIMTPNLRELELAAGTPFDPEDTASIAAAAQALVAQAGATALVVKRGERGMLVASAGEPCLPIPARGRTLFDATVVAVLATALATGAPLGDAARIANAAAGIVVGKIGTVSAEPAEIIEFMNGGSTHKVLDREALAAQVHEWRAAGKRIVVTNGCFDLLHAGHLSLLHQAAQYGDVLVLAVNSDASVQRLKGPGRPLIPEQERAAMLASLACVDAVTLFDEDTPLSLLQAIRPDVLVKGQDYKVEQVVGRDLVESNGGSVVLVPLVPDKSTTALI
jgi:D-beta-D-heptose 7-phosphate kinase/D-beta-D-heptose 1-phosphate adenosyltransferase